MDIGSILLILALSVLVALYVGRPLLEREDRQETRHLDEKDHERSALLAERDRVLDALEELDFDYALGKIPAEDYPSQRSRLVQYGAEVLRRLDALTPSASPQPSPARVQAHAEERLEQALAARRAARPAATEGQPAAPALLEADDRLEALLAERRGKRKEKSGGFCPHCGGAVHKSDRFCPKCGAKIA